MAFVISDSCVSCGSCEGECPVGAISQGDGKYEINPDSCIDCGTCASSCPTGAIDSEQSAASYYCFATYAVTCTKERTDLTACSFFFFFRIAFRGSDDLFADNALPLFLLAL